MKRTQCPSEAPGSLPAPAGQNLCSTAPLGKPGHTRAYSPLCFRTGAALLCGAPMKTQCLPRAGNLTARSAEAGFSPASPSWPKALQPLLCASPRAPTHSFLRWQCPLVVGAPDPKLQPGSPCTVDTALGNPFSEHLLLQARSLPGSSSPAGSCPLPDSTAGIKKASTGWPGIPVMQCWAPPRPKHALLTALAVSPVFLGAQMRSVFLFAAGLLSRMFFLTTLRSLFLPGMYPCFKDMRRGSALFPSNHSSASSAASGPAVSGYRSSWKRSDCKRHVGNAR